MKQHAFIKHAVLASTVLLAAPAAFAGEPAPYVAPASDCSGCIDPGFYVEGSLLYMNSYNGDINNYDGDWDLGYRGTVGFENQSGLFAQITGFYYGGDYDVGNSVSGEVDVFSLDALIGDTVHCGELCLSIAGGLRYGVLDSDESNTGGNTQSYEFDGWGPVIEIEAERSITERFGLYAELRQALLFGEQESSNGTSDTLSSVTEIGVGVQVNFAAGPVQNAFIRAGIEGQYWIVDSSDVGLFGGVIKVGGRF